MKPCIPPDLQARAEAAALRKEDAMARLIALGLEQGALEEPPDDQFMRGMAELIEADKKVVQMRRRG